MIKLVTIGGGSGQSELLQYLKSYQFDLSAIVSMVDNGGSTGRLRDQLGVLPPGDLRRCLGVLAQGQSKLHKAWEYRFTSGDLTGHPVGNLVLAGLQLQTGDMEQAVAIVSKILKVKGKVIPVTTKLTTLYAQLTDGKVVVGETNIDVPKEKTRSPIKRVYLKPTVAATPAALKAIKQAKYIVFTIGDLYTSVIPNLLVKGIPEAIQKSKAKLIYTCNRTTKLGETNKFTVLDYVNTLDRYTGRPLDTVIVDKSVKNDRITPRLVSYNLPILRKHGVEVVEASLCAADTMAVSGKKLAAVLAKLCAQ